MDERAFISQLAEDLGTDAVQTVLGVFDEDLDMLTARIVQAADAGDLDAFRRAAHGLAGAAGAVGAGRLEQGCRAAMNCPDDTEASLPHLATDLQAQAADARALFRAILAEVHAARATDV